MVTAACSDWAVAHSTRAITVTSQGPEDDHSAWSLSWVSAALRRPLTRPSDQDPGARSD
jgi:hypothetical protein